MGINNFNANGPAEVYPGVVLVPTGGLVHYVHASGAAGLDLLPSGMVSPSPGGFFTTLNAAMASCRANRGDVIVALPGHTETVGASTFLSSIKAGVRVIGRGNATDRPKLTWNNAAGNMAVSAANVWFENMQFELAGDPASVTALTTTTAITVTGNGAKFLNCHFQVGVDADQLTGLGILVNATKVEIANCTLIGDPTALIPNAGTVVRIVAADQFNFHDNYVSAGVATATDGLIESLTTLSKDIQIMNNFWFASGSGDTCAIDLGQALACTGRIDGNLARVSVDATAQTVIYSISASNNLTLGSNYSVNNSNEKPFAATAGTASA